MPWMNSIGVFSTEDRHKVCPAGGRAVRGPPALSGRRAHYPQASDPPQGDRHPGADPGRNKAERTLIPRLVRRWTTLPRPQHRGRCHQGECLGAVPRPINILPIVKLTSLTSDVRSAPSRTSAGIRPSSIAQTAIGACSPPRYGHRGVRNDRALAAASQRWPTTLNLFRAPLTGC